MKPFSTIVVVFLLALVSLNAAAVEVDRLYEAEVPVADQGTDQRTEAVHEAFVQVLVKVTGETGIASDAAAKPLLEDAEHFVQQFRYRQPPPSAPAPASAQAPAQDAAPAAPQQVLWARFDPAALNRALGKQGLPVWGRARPATLLWLAVEQNGRRELVGANSGTDMEQTLTAEADLRGLPLRLPLLDLTDQSHLSASDVWGDFDDNILAASARYQTEAVLVGRAYPAAGGWQGRWTLYQGGSRAVWDSRGDDRADVLQDGVDGAAQRLAQRFAQVRSGDVRGQRLLVQVREVGNLGDYTRAMKYLESLSPVISLEPFAVSPGKATFRLETRGGRDAIEQSVRLGRTLEPVKLPAPDLSAGPAGPPGAFSAVGTAPPAPDGEGESSAATDPSATPDLVFTLLP